MRGYREPRSATRPETIATPCPKTRNRIGRIHAACGAAGPGLRVDVWQPIHQQPGTRGVVSRTADHQRGFWRNSGSFDVRPTAPTVEEQHAASVSTARGRSQRSSHVGSAIVRICTSRASNTRISRVPLEAGRGYSGVTPRNDSHALSQQRHRSAARRIQGSRHDPANATRSAVCDHGALTSTLAPPEAARNCTRFLPHRRVASWS